MIVKILQHKTQDFFLKKDKIKSNKNIPINNKNLLKKQIIKIEVNYILNNNF